VPGIYRPRHPERSVLYRVLFHHFERFVAEYEERFEKAYGYFRPIIKDVVEKYLDCGNPRCGFARIRCPRCRTEHLLMFSCKTRGFCPSCHAKRLEEWGEWLRETLLLKYFQAATGAELRPGVVASIQTFGQKINLHPHIHCLVTEGGEPGEGTFHRVAELQDSLLAEFFKREVFALLLGEELISPEIVEMIASWRHSGFSVHSKVKAEYFS
jgi:ribosomal protein S27E